MKLAKLTAEEIKPFALRKFARKTAVENFLATMGDAAEIAFLNLMQDKRLYGWNSATTGAIESGIIYAAQKALKYER